MIDQHHDVDDLRTILNDLRTAIEILERMTRPRTKTTVRQRLKEEKYKKLRVVRDALDIAQAHGQHGLGAVEGLDRALLIHAKHQGMVGRIQVQADDVPYLLDEKWIGLELKAAAAVELHRKGLKHTMHGRLGNTAGLGRLAHTPMRTPRRLARHRTFERARNLLILEAAWPSRPQLVV